MNDVDKPAFAAAVQPAYEKYADEYGPELIERIRNSK